MACTAGASVPKILQRKDETCSFVRLELPPGGQLEVSRVFHETMVILAFSGAVWSTRQAGKTRIEVPGSVVIREAGEVFDARTLEVDPEHGAVCREIHIARDDLTALLEDWDDRIPAIDFGNAILGDRFVYDQVIETHKASEAGGCSLLRSSYMTSLAMTLAWATSRGQSARSAANDETQRYQPAIDYMRENYHRSITLQDLSRVCNANPFVLLRRFRQEMGVTPHEYLRMLRVNRAKDFILEGTRLADVAVLCGFSDQSHLNRQFKKTVGVTPGQFIADRR